MMGMVSGEAQRAGLEAGSGSGSGSGADAGTDTHSGTGADEDEDEDEGRWGTIVAVCVSPGGVPKKPVQRARVDATGIAGDGRAHAKHDKPGRAVSLLDEEVLSQLCAEGYRLVNGSMGENLTVRGLRVQELSPGTRLETAGGVVLELSEPRKPCFVLDAIDPRLKDAVINRCGYMARVVSPGEICAGERLQVVPAHAPFTTRT
jgi:MOSC domain-containing protein YiiM